MQELLANKTCGDICNETKSVEQELSYCWDGRAVLHKSNSLFGCGTRLMHRFFVTS